MATTKPAGIFQFSQMEALVHQTEDEYVPPDITVPLPKFEGDVNFGSEMKAKHFYLDKSWTFLNHGAFGAAIKEGLKASELWRVRCEEQPLRFMDREVLDLLIYALRKLALFIDSDPSDIVFVPNATTGINSVVRSLFKEFQPGDGVLVLNLAYGTVSTVVREAAKENGVVVDLLKVPLPIKSPQQIVEMVKASLKPNTKLAVFDHIPSNYAFIMPIKELTDMCHERGVEVLIDGAHCLGSVKLSMREIGADYYVANGHKWFCSPKGTAFLYVAKQHQARIQPRVISWGFDQGFTSKFLWIATMDHTPYLSFITVVDFWNHYGLERMMDYMYSTVQKAGSLLMAAWKTEAIADKSMFGTMMVIKLPDGVVPPGEGFELPYDDRAAHAVMNILHYNHKIEIPVRVIDGELYVRISAHVYNEVGEYQKLADAVLQIVKQNTNI